MSRRGKPKKLKRLINGREKSLKLRRLGKSKKVERKKKKKSFVISQMQSALLAMCIMLCHGEVIAFDSFCVAWFSSLNVKADL